MFKNLYPHYCEKCLATWSTVKPGKSQCPQCYPETQTGNEPSFGTSEFIAFRSSISKSDYNFNQTAEEDISARPVMYVQEFIEKVRSYGICVMTDEHRGGLPYIVNSSEVEKILKQNLKNFANGDIIIEAEEIDGKLYWYNAAFLALDKEISKSMSLDTSGIPYLTREGIVKFPNSIAVGKFGESMTYKYFFNVYKNSAWIKSPIVKFEKINSRISRTNNQGIDHLFLGRNNKGDAIIICVGETKVNSSALNNDTISGKQMGSQWIIDRLENLLTGNVWHNNEEYVLVLGAALKKLRTRAIYNGDVNAENKIKSMILSIKHKFNILVDDIWKGNFSRGVEISSILIRHDIRNFMSYFEILDYDFLPKNLYGDVKKIHEIKDAASMRSEMKKFLITDR